MRQLPQVIKRRTVKDVGGMQHRVELYHLVQVTDGAGGYNKEWTSLFERWAAVDDWVGVGEDERAGHIETRIGKVFTVRYSALIDPTMRLVYQDIWYEIKSLIDVGEAHKYWDIYAIGLPSES